MERIQDAILSNLLSIMNYVDQRPALVGGTAILLLISALFVFHYNSSRGRVMSKKETLEEQSLVCDIILDGMEDAIEYGLITKRRAKYWYKRLGSIGLTDLTHAGGIRGVNVTKLKKRIKYRLGNGVYKTKPTIPGPAIGEAVAYQPPKEKEKKSKTQRSNLKLVRTA